MQLYFLAGGLIVAGALLLVGLITPIIGMLVLLLEIGSIGVVGATGWHAAHVYGVVLSAALALLGPGALSIDALIYGRREIIIPR
ncbi:MAG TPA: hypothetical protein VJV05_00855 [Pyrinomonadaceae bacterium]|nr:hypothetical protein [Pyrinomonadaceae bacterium]